MKFIPTNLTHKYIFTEYSFHLHIATHLFTLWAYKSTHRGYYDIHISDIYGCKDSIDYKKINVTRYTDWAITTPIMLLVLVLAILYNKGGSLNFFDFLLILAFNYLMLGAGYLGEIGVISKRKGLLVGFLGFILLYGFIYVKYMSGKAIFDNTGKVVSNKYDNGSCVFNLLLFLTGGFSVFSTIIFN